MVVHRVAGGEAVAPGNETGPLKRTRYFADASRKRQPIKYLTIPCNERQGTKIYGDCVTNSNKGFVLRQVGVWRR